MTPHQKSALEIGGLVLAAAAVIWYVTSTNPAVAGSGDQSLPVYGGAADPGDTTASIPSVAPISGWNTQPSWPDSSVPSIIWPSNGNSPLGDLLKALNPASNNCCGCSSDADQALVTATPAPYVGGDSGVLPPAPGISTLAMYMSQLVGGPG